ncbi:Reticulon-1 isoform X1 [Aix galericulata]|nr:Reticulon-1 isoform X1 [Aix galericulata]
MASSHLFDYGSSAANGADSSFYTSLISDVHYTTPRDSTYFTGIYQQENSPIPCSGSTEGFNTLGHPVQDVTGFESRGLFSSDSGIEMTPAESTEVDKTLADPMKPSHEVVPTVTVSEPEDDSPGSVTPPSSGTEPSGSESQGKGSLSEDELISAIKEAKSFSFETPEAQRSPALSAEKQEQRGKPGRPAVPAPMDNEASSAESGDSEIELVSEDPLAAEEVLHSNYMTFSHIGGPPPSPASPSIQYSILREEREAELDSELIIESCDASSASEESPKREQDSPLMKPMVMDIIKEENGSRADALDYEASKTTESRMNRENLADSASYLKCSFVAPKISAEPPTSAVSTEELKERIILKKPIEETVAFGMDQAQPER